MINDYHPLYEWYLDDKKVKYASNISSIPFEIFQINSFKIFSSDKMNNTGHFKYVYYCQDL